MAAEPVVLGTVTTRRAQPPWARKAESDTHWVSQEERRRTATWLSTPWRSSRYSQAVRGTASVRRSPAPPS